MISADKGFWQDWPANDDSEPLVLGQLVLTPPRRKISGVPAGRRRIRGVALLQYLCSDEEPLAPKWPSPMRLGLRQ